MARAASTLIEVLRHPRKELDFPIDDDDACLSRNQACAIVAIDSTTSSSCVHDNANAFP